LRRNEPFAPIAGGESPAHGCAPSPLNVLLLEDDPADAQLIVAQLRQAGFAPCWRRVQTESDYLDSLQTAPDIILADHSISGRERKIRRA
jgi:CheY-like chemotaxis protein